jgi:hypothetical protein
MAADREQEAVHRGRGAEEQRGGGRKPDTNTDHNLEHEDEESNLPFDVQVAKSCMKDHLEMHKSYSGALKRMGNPMVKKAIQKSCNSHAESMQSIKDKCEKAYPDHKIHDIDIPAKSELRKSEADDEDEDEDEDGESEEDSMSEGEKSLLAEVLTKMESLDNKFKTHRGL